MAAPRLRLRRGSSTPVGNVTTALIGEPFVDTTGDNFYIADGASTFIHVGGSTYTSRVDEFLTATTATVGGIVTLEEGTNNGSNTIDIKAPASVTGSYDITLPAAKPGSAGPYLLEYDQASEVLAFVPSVAGETVETQNTNTDSSFFLTFVNSNNGSAGLETVFTDGELSYNPNSDILSVSGSVSVGSTGIDIAGSTSGNVTLVTAAAAGTTTITLPATTGTVVTTGDSGTVTSTMIANGTIVNDDINASAGIVDTKLATISTADKVAISALDIDSGTALAALADADLIIVDDGGGGTNKKAALTTITDYTFGKVSGDITVTSLGVATIGANAVALGTDTAGNYVSDVTAGEGLVKSSSASENQTVDLAFKNAANLTANTVLKWDDTNTQLVNSTISDDGTTVTIAGNLTVTGSNTVTNVQTTNTQVTDALLELGNGTTGSPAITRDIGLIMERGDETNIFVGFDEDLDLFIAGSTSNTGSGLTAGTITPISFLALSYNVSDSAGSNEVVIGINGSVRELQNITVDAGTY